MLKHRTWRLVVQAEHLLGQARQLDAIAHCHGIAVPERDAGSSCSTSTSTSSAVAADPFLTNVPSSLLFQARPQKWEQVLADPGFQRMYPMAQVHTLFDQQQQLREDQPPCEEQHGDAAVQPAPEPGPCTSAASAGSCTTTSPAGQATPSFSTTGHMRGRRRGIGAQLQSRWNSLGNGPVQHQHRHQDHFAAQTRPGGMQQQQQQGRGGMQLQMIAPAIMELMHRAAVHAEQEQEQGGDELEEQGWDEDDGADSSDAEADDDEISVSCYIHVVVKPTAYVSSGGLVHGYWSRCLYG